MRIGMRLLTPSTTRTTLAASSRAARRRRRGRFSRARLTPARESASWTGSAPGRPGRRRRGRCASARGRGRPVAQPTRPGNRMRGGHSHWTDKPDQRYVRKSGMDTRVAGSSRIAPPGTSVQALRAIRAHPGNCAAAATRSSDQPRHARSHRSSHALRPSGSQPPDGRDERVPARIRLVPSNSKLRARSRFLAANLATVTRRAPSTIFTMDITKAAKTAIKRQLVKALQNAPPSPLALRYIPPAQGQEHMLIPSTRDDGRVDQQGLARCRRRHSGAALEPTRTSISASGRNTRGTAHDAPGPGEARFRDAGHDP